MKDFSTKDLSYRVLSFFLSVAVLNQLALSRLLFTGMHGCLFLTLALRVLLALPEFWHRGMSFARQKQQQTVYICQPDKATGSPNGFSLCIRAQSADLRQRIRRSRGIQPFSVLGMVAVSASFYQYKA